MLTENDKKAVALILEGKAIMGVEKMMDAIKVLFGDEGIKYAERLSVSMLTLNFTEKMRNHGRKCISCIKRWYSQN